MWFMVAVGDLDLCSAGGSGAASSGAQMVSRNDNLMWQRMTQNGVARENDDQTLIVGLEESPFFDKPLFKRRAQ